MESPRDSVGIGSPNTDVADLPSAQKQTHPLLFKHHGRTSDAKPLPPRRRDDHLTTDPMVHVTYDSKAQRLFLTSHQQDLLWSDRCATYRSTLRRIVVTLQSHLTPLEKCHRLLLLHEQAVMPQRLRLRSDTYEEMFHVFYAVATSGVSESSRQTMKSSGGTSSVGIEDGSSSSVYYSAFSPFLHPLWTMYRYMVDSGTDPTAQLLQHLMGVLERVTHKDIDVEARAHSLMMDMDRMGFPPSEYTLSSYVNICRYNGVMHLALARVTDVRTRFEKAPTEGVCTNLIQGLTENGNHNEATAFISTMGSVPLTQHLLNAVLNAARCSRDPASAFTYYKAVQRSGLRPTVHTISILLETLREHPTLFAAQPQLLHFLVSEMVRLRIRGNEVMMNKVLEGFLFVKDRRSFDRLVQVMGRRKMRIFAERFPKEWVCAVR
jgi:hypothetical protein